MSLLLIWLCGVVDRIRGDDYDLAFNARITDKITYGWLVSALLGYPFHWITPIFIGLFLVGISIGWGAAMGAAASAVSPLAIEAEWLRQGKRFKWPWWMKGFLRKHAYLALVVRGLLLGICVAPVAFFDIKVLWLLPISMVAFPLASFLGWAIMSKHPSKAWETAELIRGWLIGAGVFFI